MTAAGLSGAPRSLCCYGASAQPNVFVMCHSLCVCVYLCLTATVRGICARMCVQISVKIPRNAYACPLHRLDMQSLILSFKSASCNRAHNKEKSSAQAAGPARRF